MWKKGKKPVDKITNLFSNIIFSKGRLFKVIKRFAILNFRLLPGLNKIFNNWNQPFPIINVPEPAYCNVPTDLSLFRLIKSNLWTSNLNSLYSISDVEL